MGKRRGVKPAPIIRLSAGPLPRRFDGMFDGHLLVFTDASLKRHGGLAAVLFSDHDGEPLACARTVPLDGSNTLELQAALFGLQQARQHFPERPVALFSDNQDAVARLNRAASEGLAQDQELAAIFHALDLAEPLTNTTLVWVKGHGACRGNALADEQAALAAA